MARPIDEKIVAMKMDNSDFKKKAVETTGLFGRLRDSLNKLPSTNLGAISNGLGGIQRAANGTDLSGLSRAVEGISSRFTTLGVVATTTLVNISNRVADAAINMWRGLTTKPIMDGFREYETKMGSIQTILANTQSQGTKLEDVKRSLEDLNTYADKTIYNFAEMTKNIGLFTNAGLGLEESTSMIKGFSNAAAASGANAENAARAAYQLSQGLSSGSIIQQDWMSLTNAGMGNDNMKRDLIAIAKAQAKGDKEDWLHTMTDDEMIGDWKEGLTKRRWLTKDVMSTYLQTMAGDLDKAKLKAVGLTDAQADIILLNAKTGEEAATKVRTFTQLMSTLKEGVGSSWATSFELIFGDFEQATKLWSGANAIIGPILAKTGESRNKMLKAVFRDSDALKNIFSGIKNVTKPLAQVFSAIGDGFRKAFPPMGASGIRSLFEMFRILTSDMKLSAGTVENIKTIFAGFFSIFAIGWKIIKGAATIILGLIPSFSGLGSKILELISKVARIPLAFNNASDSGKAFQSTMDLLKKVASSISNVLEYAVDGLISFVDTVAMVWDVLSKGDFSGGPWEEDSKIVDKLFDIRESVVDAVGAITTAWGILSKGDFSGGPWEEDSKIVDFLFDVREAVESIGKYLGDLEFSLTPIANGFSNFFESLYDGFNWVKDKASGIGEAIKKAFPSGNELFAGGFIAAMIGIVGLAIKMAVDLYSVFTGWGKIGESVQDVLDSVGGALNAFTAQVYAQALVTIAIAVGILAASFWLMSGLDTNDVVRGLYAIVGSLSALVIALAMMTKYDIKGTGMQASIQIIALSIAFSIMAGALKKVSNLEWGEIAKGIVGLAGVMLTFATAIAIMGKFGKGQIGASALQFIALGIAMHILFSVVEKMGEIDTGVLVQGLKALGIILLSLGLFLAVAGRSKFGAASAVGILAIGAAIKIIVSAIDDIGKMDPDKLQQGLTTIGYILLAISAFSLITGNVGVLAAGAGILLLSIALNLLLIPILSLGNMDLVTLAKGIGAIAIVLVAIGAASLLMTGMIAAGAGLIIIAAALNLLIIPLLALGNMSWGAIFKGVFGLALAMAVLGGTAALLGMIAPLILAFAAALVVVGIGMLAAGLGMSLFSTGLVALAAMTGTAITTIVAMLGTLIIGLISLIPMAIDFVVKLITQMVDALVLHGPKLFDKMTNLALTMLDKLTLKLPQFIEKGTALIVALQEGLGLAVPTLITSSIQFMVQLMEGMAQGIRENGPQLTGAFMELMGQILLLMVQTGTQMVIALFGWIPGVESAATKIGATAEKHIRENFKATDAAKDKGQEFSTGLTSKEGAVRSASKGLANAGADGADSVAFKPIGVSNAGDLVTGFISKTGAMETTGTSLANSGKSGAGSVSMTRTGSDFGTGFANGIDSDSVLSKVRSAAVSIASKAATSVRNWLDMHSPSRVSMADGGHFGTGFAIGIANKAKAVGASAKGLAISAKDSLNQFLDGFELPNGDNELHFQAVVNYDKLDTSRFGSLAPLTVRPDTSFTNGLVSATKAQLRQNDNTSPRTTMHKPKETQSVDNGPIRPIIIQNTLDGRVLSEQLVPGITALQNRNQTTVDRARGDY